MITDFDAAYSNVDAVADAADYPPRWAAEANAFREHMIGENRAAMDIRYGRSRRQRFDLFVPEGPPQGLFVFVHGGYWRRFDKSFFSRFAEGPLAAGWAVAIPSYRLAPNVMLPTIARDVAAAVASAAERVPGPVILCGHSAGGQIVTRMVSGEPLLDTPSLARVTDVISISGVHDLRPLLRTAMNSDLRLNDRIAESESPLFLTPRIAAKMAFLVGGDELPEFLRQSRIQHLVWEGLGTKSCFHEFSGRHHFDVIDMLRAPLHPVLAEILSERV